MTSPQPKYRYGTDDDEETDYFLAKVTGSADIIKKKAEDDEPVSYHLQTVTGENVRTEEIPPARGAKCAAIFAGIIACTIFIASGGAAAFIGVHELPLLYLWPAAYYGALGICGLGVVAGICGFLGACCRSNALKAMFMLFVILFALGCVVVTVIGGLFDQSDFHLVHNWVHMGNNQIDQLCSFEENYQCNGWEKQCGTFYYPTAAPGAGEQEGLPDVDWAVVAPAHHHTPAPPHRTSAPPTPTPSHQTAPSSAGCSSSAAPSSVGGSSSAVPSSVGGSSSAVPSSVGGSSSAAPSSVGGSSSAVPSSVGGSSSAAPSSAGGSSSATGSLPITPIPEAAPYGCFHCSNHELDKYTVSCKDSFHNTLSHHVLIVLGLAVGLALIAIGAAVCAYRSRSISIQIPQRDTYS